MTAELAAAAARFKDRLDYLELTSLERADLIEAALDLVNAAMTEIREGAIAALTEIQSKGGRSSEV